jgi:hypothetical protein
LTARKDYIDRHLWDYTIGTICSTDKVPAKAHHVGYDAHASTRKVSHRPGDLEGVRMIALSIAVTWLALTAAGFVALSALGRMELRDGRERDRGAGEPASTSNDMWPSMPGVSPR